MENFDSDRAEQLKIRAKGNIHGTFIPRPNGEKKPKGSRNLPLRVRVTTLTDTSDEETNGLAASDPPVASVEETLAGRKLAVAPIADLNSSFDDIDTVHLFGGEVGKVQEKEQENGPPP